MNVVTKKKYEIIRKAMQKIVIEGHLSFESHDESNKAMYIKE